MVCRMLLAIIANDDLPEQKGSSSTSSITPGYSVGASAIVKAPVVVATSAKVAVPELAVKVDVGGGDRVAWCGLNVSKLFIS